MTAEVILDVRDLCIGFPTADGNMRLAVRGVDLQVRTGEIVAAVGESGSGKSLTALACLGLIPEPGRLVSGSVRAFGVDVWSAARSRLDELRGGRIGFVFQEPGAALNPVFSIGFQIAEAFAIHRRTLSDRRDAVLRLLEEVAVPDPERVAACYPHQLSGGLAQRVMIALALAGEPGLLIADETTTALDSIRQAQILELLRELAATREMAVLMITHDISIVGALAGRTLVFLDGRVIEAGPTSALLEQPRHPYSERLIGRAPAELSAACDGVDSRGCCYADRCPVAEDECWNTPPDLLSIGEFHEVRCPPRVRNGRS
jgi:oligopeptide/dipeptide ABC transporter ATP-binding protein